MKSSKVDLFNYNPTVEDPKPVTPFTYYHPFQSSFDPEFTMSLARPITSWQNPFQINSLSPNGGDRPVGGLRMPGGNAVNPWNPDTDGFLSLPTIYLRRMSARNSTFPGGEAEGRSIYNSTWRSQGTANPVSPQEEVQTSRPSMTGRLDGLGLQSQIPLSRDCGFVGLGRPDVVVGSFEGSPFRPESSFGNSSGPAGTTDAGLSQSTNYPLKLGSLGTNISRNSPKPGHNRRMICSFCKNNREVPDIYLNHYLHDPETKKLACPVLRKHVCGVCGGTGDQAHTLQYCPVNKERGLQSKIPVLLKARTITNSTGKIRRN